MAKYEPTLTTFGKVEKVKLPKNYRLLLKYESTLSLVNKVYIYLVSVWYGREINEITDWWLSRNFPYYRSVR